MLNRLILKVTKFQLPPPKCLGTVVKNILGGRDSKMGLLAQTTTFRPLLWRANAVDEN